MRRLTRVRADRLSSETDDIALFDQPGNEIRVRTGRIRAFLAHVEIGHRIRFLGPVGAHQKPGTRRNPGVLRLPLLDPLDGEQIVRIRGASVLQSMTQACATNISGEIVSVALLGRSLPEIQ